MVIHSFTYPLSRIFTYLETLPEEKKKNYENKLKTIIEKEEDSSSEENKLYSRFKEFLGEIYQEEFVQLIESAKELAESLKNCMHLDIQNSDYLKRYESFFQKITPVDLRKEGIVLFCNASSNGKVSRILLAQNLNYQCNTILPGLTFFLPKKTAKVSAFFSKSERITFHKKRNFNFESRLPPVQEIS